MENFRIHQKTKLLTNQKRAPEKSKSQTQDTMQEDNVPKR